MCVDKSRQFGKELRLKSQFITLRANPEPASVRFWEWDCLVKYRIIPVNSTILSSLFNRFQSDLSSPPERMSAVRQAAVQISSLPTPKAKHPTTRGSFTRWCALAGSPVSIWEPSARIAPALPTDYAAAMKVNYSPYDVPQGAMLSACRSRQRFRG